MTPRALTRLRRLAFALVAFGLLVGAAHVAIGRRARLVPPDVAVPSGSVSEPRPGFRRFGASSTEKVGGLLVAHLSGSPEAIGYAHSRLFYREMVDDEGILLGEFRRMVSFAPARWLLLDMAELRYHDVDRGFSDPRRREIAAGARGFSPDPYASLFPTYQRFSYLNALYDISLSFEKSPLIGCTTFTFAGEGGSDTLLARAFDFDVNDVFDREKAVFFVREDGVIPFASVAWPGLIGVVSGMNVEGLALVVHGARAGEPRSFGEPVVHALRRVLSTCKTVDEAARAFAERDPMVSHIVIASDASGKSIAIERIPGQPPFVRALPTRAVVTNHFYGPGANDPKNLAVRKKTSTLAREARGQELIKALDHPARVDDAVRMLRDRFGKGGVLLPHGDRRAIDADIATHGVVMDTTRRVLWVSEAPHLRGRFVAFDLGRELSPERDPDAKTEPVATLPATWK
jgi:isopenicillin-N N-acyltransferase-like protein